MTDSLHQLVSALREELQSYGALLDLLDRQQDLVCSRAAEELSDVVGAIQTQSRVLNDARAFRDECRVAVAKRLQLPADAPFGILIPLLPADYQPLLQALVQENNELLVRVQKRARQNHLLLSRSVELMQQFLGSLFPGRDNPTYSVTGRGRSPSLPASTVYDAVG
jgi:flagellar biosynthesis/type III secretory pathway chaperone